MTGKSPVAETVRRCARKNLAKHGQPLPTTSSTSLRGALSDKNTSACRTAWTWPRLSTWQTHKSRPGTKTDGKRPSFLITAADTTSETRSNWGARTPFGSVKQMNTAVISANTGYLNLKIGFASTYENQSDLLIDTFIFLKVFFSHLQRSALVIFLRCVILTFLIHVEGENKLHHKRISYFNWFNCRSGKKIDFDHVSFLFRIKTDK